MARLINCPGPGNGQACLRQQPAEIRGNEQCSTCYSKARRWAKNSHIPCSGASGQPCPHPSTEPIYRKGRCRSCFEKIGRICKNPACPHSGDMVVIRYQGLCHACWTNPEVRFERNNPSAAKKSSPFPPNTQGNVSGYQPSGATYQQPSDTT